MLIKSDLRFVTERQINCGVYRAEQFVDSPYMSSYWSGHLIEELLEFVDENSPLKLADEAADVIIFLQNLTAYLYPQSTLTIDLDWFGYPTPFPKLLLSIRRNLPDRKTWKTYKVVNFMTWQREVVIPVIQFLLDFVNHKDLYNAYQSKMAYNQVREDWS